MVETIDITIEDMKQELIDIKQKLIELRKKGKYTKICEMKMAMIPSKIKMVEVTRDVKDVSKVTKLIDDAKKEVNFTEKDGYKIADEIDPFLEIVKLMGQINEAIKGARKKEAVELYGKAQNLYKDVQQNYKKEIYLRLVEVHAKLSK